jgi:single-strand DNA-binding protein
MASLNKTLLIGNVGKDPEIKVLDGGNKVGNITLATSFSFTDRNGQRKEETEWHTVITYGKLSDVVEKYIRKGSLLFVDGRLHTRTWEENGKTRYRTDIIANAIQMLNRVDQAGPQKENLFEDDLPL